MKKYDDENSFHRKYTKNLMIISAIFLAVNGFVLSFFPNESSQVLSAIVKPSSHLKTLHEEVEKIVIIWPGFGCVRAKK